jgi:sodium/potassium-transporting ATPase subunit beta
MEIQNSDSTSSQDVAVKHESRLKKLQTSTRKFGKYLWNAENREVMGRDGLSWAKVSLCYFFFYTGLACFFVGMLAVFVATLDRKEPRYTVGSSLIGTNPGVGFRPQLNPESNLIAYSLSKVENPGTSYNSDFARLLTSINIFLNYYYVDRQNKDGELNNCDVGSLDQIRDKFKEGFYCPYNFTLVLKGTECDPDINYGYMDGNPCVILKLNRMYDWLPEAYASASALPEAIRDVNELINENIYNSSVIIKCDGEFSADRDALRSANISYYSAESYKFNFYKLGLVPFYYFPYMNQNGYQTPLVFVQFKNINRFQLINVICRAYAANIKSDDRLNLRGMTRFQIFIDN